MIKVGVVGRGYSLLDRYQDLVSKVWYRIMSTLVSYRPPLAGGRGRTKWLPALLQVKAAARALLQ